jgi:hypothetical protein
MTVRTLAYPMTMDALMPSSLQLVGALRFWALAIRLRWCPIRTVATRLGSLRAAAHLGLIVEEMGAAWPDPFCISPPCSPRLSHDEATAAAMLHRAARGDRPEFDRLLADLLPADARERLFHSFFVLASLLDGSLEPRSL